jgi:hypothetical protein
MDMAPVAVRDPEGNLTGPHRAWITEGRFRVANVTGEVLVDVEGDVAQESMSQAWIDTDEGRWHVRTLCGCNAQMRQWRRDWREAAVA